MVGKKNRVNAYDRYGRQKPAKGKICCHALKMWLMLFL